MTRYATIKQAADYVQVENVAPAGINAGAVSAV